MSRDLSIRPSGTQYFNPTTGHLAADCIACGRLVEVQQAHEGDTTICSFCGLPHIVVPVTVAYRRLDAPFREEVVEWALRLDPHSKD